MVAQIRNVVAVRAKPYDSLPVQVELHRPHLGDQDINTHVPLDASDQQRVADVLLNYALLLQPNLHAVVDD